MHHGLTTSLGKENTSSARSAQNRTSRFPRPSSSALTLSVPSGYGNGTNHPTNKANSAKAQRQYGKGYHLSSIDSSRPLSPLEKRGVRLPTACDIAPRPESLLASALLLQTIPCRPTTFNRSQIAHSDRLISEQLRDAVDSGPDSKSAMQEATRNVRLLLDKWTTSGSAPASGFR